MAFNHKTSNNTGLDTQSVSTLVVSAPTSGQAVDDVVVCILMRYSAAPPAVTLPPDFVEFGSEVAASNGFGRMRFYYKRITTVEAPGTTYSFAWGSPLQAWAVTQLWGGCTKTGDPASLTYFTSVAGNFGAVPTMSVTTDFAPALVWALYRDTTGGFYNKPTGYNVSASMNTGYIAYSIPGGTGGVYSAANGSPSTTSPACAALFSLIPPPPLGLAGDIQAASGATGDLTTEGAFINAASSAAGTLGVARDVAGQVEAAAELSATGFVHIGAPVALAAAAEAAAELAGSITAALTLAAVAGTAGELAGDLTVAPPLALAGVLAVAGELAAAVTVTRPGEDIDLAGRLDVASSASAALSVSVAVFGAAPMALAATALVERVGLDIALDGAVCAAGSAFAALGRTVDTAGAAELVVWAAGAVAGVRVGAAAQAELAVWAGLGLDVPSDRNATSTVDPRRCGATVSASRTKRAVVEVQR